MKIVVLFPGIGYHCEKPLLYYAGKLSKELNYDEIVKLSYQFSGGNIRGNLKKMQEAFENLFAQAEDSLSNIKWDDYDEIVFISKSIGTIIACAYEEKYKLKHVKQILYTPMEYTFMNIPKDAIGFIGTKDPWSELAKVETIMKEKNIPLHIYEDADHSLETEHVLTNMQILLDVIEKTKVYLSNNE